MSSAGPAGSPQEPSPSDEALLTAICSGSEAGLESLYNRYGGLVYTVALRIVGDRDLAQEVLQDVFLRCWERAATFDAERGRLAGWLLRIARNRAIDLLRSGQHQARLRERELNAMDDAGDPRDLDPLDQLAVRHTVKHALNSLPQAQRQAIELAFYGGLTQAEVANVTATPLGTVKTRIRDGMLRLRALLAPFEEPGAEARNRHA